MVGYIPTPVEEARFQNVHHIFGGPELLTRNLIELADPIKFRDLKIAEDESRLVAHLVKIEEALDAWQFAVHQSNLFMHRSF
jgi:hypothetical protein